MSVRSANGAGRQESAAMVGRVFPAVQSLWSKVRLTGEKRCKSLFIIKLSFRATCLLLASVGCFRCWNARIRASGDSAVEDVITDRCRFCPADSPRRLDAGAVKIQRAVSRVVGRIRQQGRRNVLRPGPACLVARRVALAITPPGELARGLFSALVNDITRRIREVGVCHAIQYCPPDGNQAIVTFSASFPIQCQRETALLFFRVIGVRIFHAKQCNLNEQNGQHDWMRFQSREHVMIGANLTKGLYYGIFKQRQPRRSH